MFFKKTKNTQEFSDAELIIKYKESGDSYFVGELYKRYTHLVFGVCLKYLKDSENSKDAVMQIFENLLEDLKKHEIENFKSWLYSVARNYCLMQIRKQPIMVRIDNSEEFNSEFMEFDEQLHLLDDKELQLINLEAAMKTLNEQQRICLELFYLKEKSYKEIVEVTGFNSNEVKSHLQNAKRNLKNYLNSLDGKENL